MLKRRSLLVGAALGLTGCGFHPLYGTHGATGETASADLKAVDVVLTPERIGQELRLSLQQRLEGAGGADHKLYDLTVLLSFNEDIMGILSDSSPTRLRYSGAVNYFLRARDEKKTLLTAGVAKASDAANIYDNQPFATDLETEVVERRMMDQIADLIVSRLAAYFDKHPGGR